MGHILEGLARHLPSPRRDGGQGSTPREEMCALDCSSLAFSWTGHAEVRETTYTCVDRLCSEPQKVLADGHVASRSW